MNIALIDVDNFGKLNNCFPNIPLMKISAFHKSKGDNVEWYNSKCHYDICYVSKVFSFTPDINFNINADNIIFGGSGYAIKMNAGKEIYIKDTDLLPEVEHIYPDYSLYGITDTAYGFMSRGCPRGCAFCHVVAKEGKRSYKVADLSEFWKGQKYIELLDPNMLACDQWKNILEQLYYSNSYVNFNQGVDIRLMTKEKAELIRGLKIKHIHFAWDRIEDGKYIKPKLEEFKRFTNWKRNKVTVYILTNFNTSISEDIERIEFVRSLNFQPYIMRYDKEHIKRGSEINALARYVNNKRIFWKCDSFDQYKIDIRKCIRRK